MTKLKFNKNFTLSLTNILEITKRAEAEGIKESALVDRIITEALGTKTKKLPA